MRPLIISCLVLLLIQGCATQTREPADQASISQEEQAQTYLSAGNFTAAAEEYLLLAEQNKSRSEKYLLRAADAYLQGNQITPAQSILDKIKSDKLTPVQQIEKNILTAQIAISNNDALLAITTLDFELTADTPQRVLTAYYSAQAEALQMDQQYSKALHARARLARYADDPELTDNNHQKTWELLSFLTVPDLEQELANTSEDVNLAGWLELAIVSKTGLYDQEKLEYSIASWSQRYPNHPARGEIIEDILALAEKENTRPKQIALLLPFNSQYRDISNAIREGFLSAWYNTPGERPLIRIYNSDHQNVLDTYKTAVNEGAEFIVGPLEKEAVTALMESGNMLIKTLALNQVDVDEYAGNPQGNPASDFFQFGLSPEDEAGQAADRAWSDGHANALVITPDTTWGERIYNAFSTRWNQLGGVIVEHVRIPAGTQDFSTPVKQLLNIENSEQRAKELIATLHRKIFSEPRYRRDADIIFLASTPLMARQIVPQLRYYQANDIVTYSISSIYSGNFDPEANSDINDVIFTDMPWMIDPGHEYSILQQTLNKSLDQNQSPYRRFYAFGVDAYQLIFELGRLYSQNNLFTGVTGDLKVNNQGYIQRTSAWAKFVNGSPQLLEAQ